MQFLAPTAFALAALLPLVLAMYFLKLRREDHRVSSIFLWEQVLRDYEANAPWQRLRRNLLLLLQLLVLIALILSLARPFIFTDELPGQSLILLVDTSTSMAATDVQPSRLEAAKQRARAIIDGLSEEVRVTIIAAGSMPQVLLSNARDPRAVREAIDRLQIENGASDLATALSLAGAVAARQASATIVILSDGRVDLPPMELPAPVRYIPIGEQGNNQAVSAVSVRALAGGQTISLFAQVTNHHTDPVSRRLTIYVDGQLFDAHDVTIPAGKTAEIVQDDLPATTQQVEVRLAGHDILAADDRAWAIRATGKPAPILLVTEGNLFLETALSLLPNIQLTISTPEDYNARASDTRPETADSKPQPADRLPSTSPGTDLQSADYGPQLIIFDGVVPATLPMANAFFIAPPSATAWFTPTGTIETPAVGATNSDDPLMRYVDLSGLQILEARAIQMPEWGYPVASTPVMGAALNGLPGSRQPLSSDGSAVGSQPPEPASAGKAWPLLFTGQVAGQRVAVLAFDLRNSDLALRPAFPILLSNLIDFLVPGARGVVPGQVEIGEPVTLALPPEVDAVHLVYPDGRETDLTSEGGRLTFVDTRQVGIYQIAMTSQGNQIDQAAFAVNLFLPGESSLAPRATLPIAGAAPAQRNVTAHQRGGRELWRPLAMAGLVLLLMEWLVYQRSALTRLRHGRFGSHIAPSRLSSGGQR